MFAYCNNNPVSNADYTGEILGTVIGAVVGGTFAGVVAALDGKSKREILAEATSGAIAGAVSGFAADVITVTGGTALAVAGVFAGAGAIGSGLGEAAKIKINGGKLKSSSSIKSIGKEVLNGAVWGAVFGAMEGPVDSLAKRAAKQGVSVARKCYNMTRAFFQNKPVKKILTRGAEEILANFTTWVGNAGSRSVYNYYRNCYAR